MLGLLLKKSLTEIHVFAEFPKNNIPTESGDCFVSIIIMHL